jgi:hypothetical protein
MGIPFRKRAIVGYQKIYMRRSATQPSPTRRSRVPDKLSLAYRLSRNYVSAPDAPASVWRSESHVMLAGRPIGPGPPILISAAAASPPNNVAALANAHAGKQPRWTTFTVLFRVAVFHSWLARAPADLAIYQQTPFIDVRQRTYSHNK